MNSLFPCLNNEINYQNIFPLISDSTHISDMGLDSQGKPFTYEIGNIPGVNAPFSTSDLVCWAWQVAQGMDYLMRRKVLLFLIQSSSSSKSENVLQNWKIEEIRNRKV